MSISVVSISRAIAPAKWRSMIAFVIAALALTTAACSSSSSTSGQGNVSVLLTDSPFPYDLVAHANLFIVRIDAGSDTGSTGAPCTNAATLATPNQAYDLLTLHDGLTASLAQSQVPAGSYGGICLTIDVDKSNLVLKNGTVLTGTSHPGVNWQSQGLSQMILKAQIYPAVTVTNVAGTFLIHFDVGHSFHSNLDLPTPVADGGYWFEPLVKIVDPATTGDLTGTVVDGQNANAAVANASIEILIGDPNAPPSNWAVVATVTSDAQGAFKAAYLLPNSQLVTGWSYMVRVSPPTTLTRTPQVRSGLIVTVGSATVVGTVTL